MSRATELMSEVHPRFALSNKVQMESARARVRGHSRPMSVPARTIDGCLNPGVCGISMFTIRREENATGTPGHGSGSRWRTFPVARRDGGSLNVETGCLLDGSLRSRYYVVV